MLTPQEIRQVDDTGGFGFHHGAHDIVKLRHIAPHDLDLRAQVGKRRGARVDVHTDHLLAAGRQPSDDPGANEPGTAYHHDWHRCASSVMPEGIARRIPGPDATYPGRPPRD